MADIKVVYVPDEYSNPGLAGRVFVMDEKMVNTFAQMTRLPIRLEPCEIVEVKAFADIPRPLSFNVRLTVTEHWSREEQARLAEMSFMQQVEFFREHGGNSRSKRDWNMNLNGAKSFTEALEGMRAACPLIRDEHIAELMERGKYYRHNNGDYFDLRIYPNFGPAPAEHAARLEPGLDDLAQPAPPVAERE